MADAESDAAGEPAKDVETGGKLVKSRSGLPCLKTPRYDSRWSCLSALHHPATSRGSRASPAVCFLSLCLSLIRFHHRIHLGTSSSTTTATNASFKNTVVAQNTTYCCGRSSRLLLWCFHFGACHARRNGPPYHTWPAFCSLILGLPPPSPHNRLSPTTSHPNFTRSDMSPVLNFTRTQPSGFSSGRGGGTQPPPDLVQFGWVVPQSPQPIVSTSLEYLWHGTGQRRFQLQLRVWCKDVIHVVNVFQLSLFRRPPSRQISSHLGTEPIPYIAQMRFNLQRFPREIVAANHTAHYKRIS